MATLKVCMNLSANPLVEGWYKDTRMCLIPLNWQKLANSPDTICGLLSETSCSGNPFAANIFLSTATVCVAVVVDISLTTWSGRLQLQGTYVPETGQHSRGELWPRVWWAMTMGVMVQQLGNFAPSGTGYKP